ncbi:MAG: hypothetical protein Q8L53_16690 [Aestuariivirga sp.]|nr:hypothetical protein [Aestuariivirga sp.]
MAKIQIGDKVIEVDDSFMQLSPQDQQKTVDEIEQSIGGAAPQQAAQGETNLSDIPGQALQNASGDAMEVGKSIYEAFRHPVQTAQGAVRLAAGGLANIPGVQGFNDWAENAGIAAPRDRAAEQQDMDLAGQVGQHYKDAYGSWPAIKKSLATKPVSSLLDASTVLGGSGAVLKAPLLGSTSAKVGRAFTTAGNIVNPINAVTKPTGLLAKGATPMLGLSTGAGGQSVLEAFRAGERGGSYGKSFRANMRGKEPQDAVIADARAALAKMVDDRRKEYNQGMAATKANKAVLDYAPVETAMQDLVDTLFHGPVSTTDKASLGLAKEVGKSIDEWKKNFPNPTAEDFDRLKIKIDNLKPNWTQETGDQGRIIATMYNAVKNEIMAKEPTYAKTMKAYEESKAVQTEIEQALSLKKKSSKDAALRKLQSVLRDNANTNYGSRVDNVKKLQATGAAPNIMPKLAGQSLKSMAPRGLSKLATTGLLGGAMFQPQLLGLLPFTSPRLVGELTHLLGRAKPKSVRGALLPAYQAGQVYDQTRQ